MMRLAPRPLAITVVATALLASAVPCFAQSASESNVRLPAVYSTQPMTRNADLTLAAAIFALSATDVALDRVWSGAFDGERAGGRMVRAAKLAGFDLPVALYFVDLNHELGHIARADERGVPLYLSLVGTPWSPRWFDLEADVRFYPTPHAPNLYDVGIEGGGLEASRHFKERSEARTLRSERIPVAQALATVYASLNTPLYAAWNLSRSRDESQSGLPRGDMARYVFELERRHSRARDFRSLDDLRRQVRTRSALNLVDFGLWTQAADVLREYVWRGNRTVPVRWVRLGKLQVIPSLRYELSPVSPEYSARSHYRLGDAVGTAYVRWTERIGADRQVGSGLSLSRWRVRGIRPELSVDVWSHTRDGRGLNAAVAAEVTDWPSRRAALTVAIGAKSAGHLPGFSLEGSGYASLGFTLTPW